MFQADAFQVDAFQHGDALGVVGPGVAPPAPTPSGGAMRGGSGLWTRVHDDSVVHLNALDTTAYVLLDRPAIGIERLQTVVVARLDRPVIGLSARLGAADVVVAAHVDRPALGRDDLPEIARLLRSTARKPPAIEPPADVSAIWSLIDRMRGKKT